MSDLAKYQQEMLPAIHAYLNEFVDELFADSKTELRTIFRYHIGLDAPIEQQGKRVRPWLVLICAQGAGGDWRSSLPAAAAFELVHNFSLIHDDIEDNGETRRGQAAVWRKWGLAPGLNAGDVMFATAFKALENLQGQVPDDVLSKASLLVADTCFRLTKGQQLDIEFQHQERVLDSEYEEMIAGKTAALLGACCQMGALLAGKDESEQKNYRQFGQALGMAFQVYDDWLGVWGQESETGKSTYGDLMEGKKSLPVILGFEASARFAQRWGKGALDEREAQEMARWLLEDGVSAKVKQAYEHWTAQASQHLEEMDCEGEVKLALREFANKLLTRNK